MFPFLPLFDQSVHTYSELLRAMAGIRCKLAQAFWLAIFNNCKPSLTRTANSLLQRMHTRTHRFQVMRMSR